MLRRHPDEGRTPPAARTASSRSASCSSALIIASTSPSVFAAFFAASPPPYSSAASPRPSSPCTPRAAPSRPRSAPSPPAPSAASPPRRSAASPPPPRRRCSSASLRLLLGLARRLRSSSFRRSSSSFFRFSSSSTRYRACGPHQQALLDHGDRVLLALELGELLQQDRLHHLRVGVLQLLEEGGAPHPEEHAVDAEVVLDLPTPHTSAITSQNCSGGAAHLGRHDVLVPRVWIDSYGIRAGTPPGSA